MYPFIKIGDDTRKKILCVFLVLFSLILIVWYVLSGIQLEGTTYVIDRNTRIVQGDKNIVKVEHISTNDDVYLEDTTRIDGSKVKNYIRVSMGNGTYFRKGSNELVAELSLYDSVKVGLRFMVLDIVVFAILLISCLYSGNYKSLRVLSLVALFGFLVYSWVILSNYFDVFFGFEWVGTYWLASKLVVVGIVEVILICVRRRTLVG